MREFDTGATRDTDDSKFDYEGFLSHDVLERFASYMHDNRIQADGNVRDSDNWQKGIPQDAYMKSAFRHFLDWWQCHRRQDNPEYLQTSLCALLFNVMGYLHEELKLKGRNIVKGFDPDTAEKMEQIVEQNATGPGPHYIEGCGDSEPICDGDREIEPLTEEQRRTQYVTSVTEGPEWDVSCPCGWSGQLDQLVLDQVNAACLCPDCQAPLMGLSLEIEAPDTENLYERVVKLIQLADAHDVSRDKLLKMIKTRMGSM